ncbi:hypothetical protein [Nocardioides acrostichi]|uniref:Uncharacterized protein n=1 Tax=Nocardioides acrostichi TaxID=2784339 RepID=A0A930V181_9ACTN|nr:hypothetical protein [Nocardioides acrostichi]MBF4163527.1 hypothetical protein [Nocardioides acrostichi]
MPSRPDDGILSAILDGEDRSRPPTRSSLRAVWAASGLLVVCVLLVALSLAHGLSRILDWISQFPYG